MDPLFKAYGSITYQRRDEAIRYVEERDIPAIAELFRLTYGERYPYVDVYDGSWVKQSIHSDQVICLVFEEDAKIIGTGSVVLEYGDYNDKCGELGRMVTHPGYSGKGVGKRVIDALLKVAENALEFAIGEARTAHSIMQKMMEKAGLTLIGFVPQYHLVKDRRESQVLYARVQGDGRLLRSPAPPRVIPEAASLVAQVLAGLNLMDESEVVNEPLWSQTETAHAVRPLDRDSTGPLLRIPNGRLIDPLLFGNVSLERGYALVRDKARYLVAFDGHQNPVGTIGYQFDHVSRLIKGVELIGVGDEVWPSLCRAMLHEAEQLAAEMIIVDVSAYNPRLQRLLFELGFRPVAYAPSMVFKGTDRLDVIKMVKLNVPYDPGEMILTERAKQMVALVEANFV
jgi:RimJ/RimL family protein N-acetyltransferase